MQDLSLVGLYLQIFPPLLMCPVLNVKGKHGKSKVFLQKVLATSSGYRVCG